MSTPHTPSSRGLLTPSTTPQNNNNTIQNVNSINKELAYCIVWSPLPPITWICPFIGHLGICNSNGIASDFRGPYFVGDDGRGYNKNQTPPKRTGVGGGVLVFGSLVGAPNGGM